MVTFKVACKRLTGGGRICLLFSYQVGDGICRKKVRVIACWGRCLTNQVSNKKMNNVLTHRILHILYSSYSHFVSIWLFFDESKQHRKFKKIRENKTFFVSFYYILHIFLNLNFTLKWTFHDGYSLYESPTRPPVEYHCTIGQNRKKNTEKMAI